MTYWIRDLKEGKMWSTATPFTTIVEARKYAIRILENGPKNRMNIAIYSAQYGIVPVCLVERGDMGFYESKYDRKYGVINSALYKNGKIQR